MFDGADLPDRLVDHQAEAQLIGSLLGHPEHIEALPPGFGDAVLHHPDHADLFRHVMLNPTTAARFAIARDWAAEDPDRRKYVAELLACVVDPWQSHLVAIAAYLLDLHQRREARDRLRAAADAWDCPAFVDTDDAFQRGVLPCPRPVLRMPLSFVVR